MKTLKTSILHLLAGNTSNMEKGIIALPLVLLAIALMVIFGHANKY